MLVRELDWRYRSTRQKDAVIEQPRRYPARDTRLYSLANVSPSETRIGSNR